MDIPKASATASKKRKTHKRSAIDVPPANMCLDHLLNDITGEDTPAYIQQVLLEVLSEVDNKVQRVFTCFSFHLFICLFVCFVCFLSFLLSFHIVALEAIPRYVNS